jgi:hypothetical protein
MAFADLTAYTAALAAPTQDVYRMKASAGTVGSGGRLASWWIESAQGGTAPTTAVACSSSTSGALGQADGGSGALYAVAADLDYQRVGSEAASSAVWLLVDRLSHQGGLDGTVTSAQTTNLPTATLTRYTSGVGVWAALEIYTAIGTGGATASVSYTNQAGTAGRTSVLPFGVSGYSIADGAVVVPLVSGDMGVKSVESVTLSGSTGSAGNFGVTLFRPLMAFPCGAPADPFRRHALNSGWGGGMPEIVDGACLQWMSTLGASNTTSLASRLHFAEA